MVFWPLFLIKAYFLKTKYIEWILKQYVSCVSWNRQVQHILASTFGSRCVVWDLRKNEPIIKVSDSMSRVSLLFNIVGYTIVPFLLGQPISNEKVVLQGDSTSRNWITSLVQCFSSERSSFISFTSKLYHDLYGMHKYFIQIYFDGRKINLNSNEFSDHQWSYSISWRWIPLQLIDIVGFFPATWRCLLCIME
jgi:hypothetical protein